jgi:hypothetical protein
MCARAAWISQLLDKLERSDEAGAAGVRYLRVHGIRLDTHEQSTAARWTVGRKIELHPRYTQGPPGAPYTLSLVMHEIQHFRQGLPVALSVYGEMDAWQIQFRFLRSVAGAYPMTADQSRLIGELLALPLGWARPVLRTAQGIMRQYGGQSYRIDLLPLYPLHKELLFRFGGREPG